MPTLHDTVIVITGAGSGLGREIALAAADSGANVVLVGRTHDKLHSTQQAIASRGAQSLVVVCDITNADERDEALQQIGDTFGRIDILVNNAGIWFEGPIDTHADHTIEDVITTNLTAQIEFTKHILGVMQVQSEGQILMINATHALSPSANDGVYSAAKAGLDAFTTSLDKQTTDSAIRVLSLYPSGMDTPLFDTAGFTHREEDRMMDPADVANIAMFMLQQPIDVQMSHVRVHKKIIPEETE